MCVLFILPLIVLIFLLCVVLFFLRKYKIGIFLFFVGCSVDCYYESIPFCFNKSVICNDKCKLKIISYNVCGSGYYMHHGIDSLNAIKTFLDSIDADIICFQEYDRSMDNGVLSNHLIEKYPFHSSMYNSVIGTYDPIYSKYPIEDFYLFTIPERIQVFGMKVHIRDNESIYLVNCHLTSNKYTVARDSMKTEDSWISGIPEYYRYLSAGYDRRAFESQIVADSIITHSNVPMLVCGDLNDVSGSYALKTIQSAGDLKDAWWAGGCGFGWTYDAHHLKLRLDHILYSKDFELVNVSVPHVKFSDHYPVVADFVFKK